MLPASLTHNVSADAACPTAVHKASGFIGARADTRSGTAARGDGAGRDVGFTVSARTWAALANVGNDPRSQTLGRGLPRQGRW